MAFSLFVGRLSRPRFRGASSRTWRPAIALAIAAALLAGLLVAPVAAQEAQDVDRSPSVFVQGYIGLGSSGWWFSPTCASGGTAGAGCGLSLSGGYTGQPAGSLGGCLARNQGTGGSGDFFVLDTLSWTPRLQYDISDFGWEIAEGWGTDSAVVRGRWQDASGAGRIEGALSALTLSSYCDYYYVSGVLQFVPDGVPEDPAWGNSSPRAPALVAPAEGQEFGRQDQKLFAVRAEDPDGDAYVAVVSATDAQGVTTTFTTPPAASGTEASTQGPVLQPGTYTWTAQACDPGGTRECGPASVPRTFKVLEQQEAEDARKEVDRSPTLYVQGYLSLGSSSWSFWPQACLSGGTGGALCAVDLAGSYGEEPAGSLGGCLGRKAGAAGTGSVAVFAGLEPDVLEFDITEFGWETAEGFGAEAAVVRGRWDDPSGDAAGRVEGVLSSALLSSYCDYYYVSGILQFVPDGTPTDPAVDNESPGAPSLVEPADGVHFTRTAPKRATLSATDPDQDVYVGLVTVTGPDGVGRTFSTTPAESGTNSWGDFPVTEPGVYRWSAQACDPAGNRECGPSSVERTFTIDPSSADGDVADLWKKADRAASVLVTGYLSYQNGNWRVGTWDNSCQHVGTQWVVQGGLCALDVAGPYGSTPPLVNGGCLTATAGAAGTGTLKNLAYDGTGYEFALTDFGWTASGVYAETGAVAGKWSNGTESGRIDGYIQTSSNYSSSCYFQMTLQLAPADAPETPDWPPPGNQPPAAPTLLLPDPYHQYRIGQVHQFNVKGVDPDDDTYHGEFEWSLRSGTQTDASQSGAMPLTPAASGGISTGVIPGYLPPGEYQWRARACDPAGSGTCGSWTAYRFFSVMQQEYVPTEMVDFEQVFDFTGKPEAFVVPESVREVTVEAWGAAGGGRTKATIPVTPGEVLAVFTGGAADGRTGGFNGGGSGGAGGADGGNCGTYGSPGGGGGGASDVRQAGISIFAAADSRVVVAGGGGGGGGGPYGGWGGSAGGYSGASGGTGYAYDQQSKTMYPGAWGGSGGYSGGWGGYGGNGYGDDGSSGTNAIGGSGGAGGSYANNDPWSHCGAGGGGGGGGGGGFGLGGGGGGGQRSSGWTWRNKSGGGGGGGGASFVAPAAQDVEMESGVRSGHGAVVLRWVGPVYHPGVPQLRYAYSDQAGFEHYHPYRSWDLGRGSALVNLSNGNLVVQDEGLSIPGPINLRLTHTYNRIRDPKDGPLGKGWSLGVVDGDGVLESLLSAVMSLDINQAAEIIGTEDIFEVYDGDGTRHHFVKGGLAGPGWHSPPGVDLTLKDGLDPVNGRWYHATRPDGVRYEFGLVGVEFRLTKISDRKGNALTFTYVGGKLSQIADGTGRTVTFTWNGNLLTKARYLRGSQFLDVVYTVDAATGRLSSVTRAAGTPDAQTTSFTYDGVNGLARVRDPRGAETAFTYDDTRLTRVSDRAGKTWILTYEGPCQPGSETGVRAVCVTDPEGHAQIWSINAAGNVVHVRDEGETDESNVRRHNERTYVWKDNRLTRHIDEAGTTTDHEYDEFGRITKKVVTGAGENPAVTTIAYEGTTPGVSDIAEARTGVGTADLRVWSFEYDEEGKGLLTSQTDPTGATTRFAYYGTRSFLKSVTNPLGRTTTYGNTALPDGGYDVSGQPAKITDPTGAFMTVAFDYLGRPTSRVDRAGKTWSQSWDLRGNLLSSTTPMGNVTRFCYDPNDNNVLLIRPKALSTLCSQTGTEGHVTKFEYDARDLPTDATTSSDGQLRRTRNVYADDGQLASTLHPRSFNSSGALSSPQRVSYERYPNNRVSAYVDPEGSRTSIVYTPTGLPHRVTEPPSGVGNRITTTTYNGLGRETAVLVSGHAAPTRFEHNVHGEVIRSSSPQGRTTTLIRDALGRAAKVVDPAGRVSERTYDLAGNLLAVKQPAGLAASTTTTYTYTPRGEIATETDPADSTHVVAYVHDAEGRQIARHDQTNGVTKRSVQEMRRADGLVTERRAWFAGTSVGEHKTALGYDANNNVTSIATTLDGAASPNVSQLSIGYSSADEPVSWTETLYPVSGPAVGKSSTFAFDRDRTLLSRTLDGKTTAYSYLRNGLERTTTAWGGADTVLTSSWYLSGLPRSVELEEGVRTDYAFDLAGRLTEKVQSDLRPQWNEELQDFEEVSVEVGAWRGLTYDQDDLRTAEVVTQRQWDDTVERGTGTYGYDALGRLVSAKHPFETQKTTYALDDAGNILSDGATASSYVNNQLTERRPLPTGLPTTFTYDGQGNMASQTTGSQTTSYTYDAMGHPRRTTMPDGKWVEYAYDGLGRLSRATQSDASTTLFFHDGGADCVAMETNGNGTADVRYVLDSAGEPVAQDMAGVGLFWYGTDLRGNVTQLQDSTGEVGATYAYDAYGRDKPALSGAAPGVSSRLRYQMARRDPVTGVYNLGPRLFDPAINRFIGADFYVAAAANMGLTLDPLTGNRYLYAGANPAGMIDDGHAPAPSCRRMSRATITEYLTGVACPPADFERYLGYTPQLVTQPWGNRFIRPEGSCSSPTIWVTAKYHFTHACRTHDYGYDLIRYFRATGRTVTEDTRAVVDRVFRSDLHATCSHLYGAWYMARTRVNCHAWGQAYYSAVRLFGGFVFDEYKLEPRY